MMPKLSDISNYMISQAFDIGILQFDGMGMRPLNWQDLEAWIRVRGVPISSFEASMIMTISRTYVSSYNEFDGKAISPPWREVIMDTPKLSTGSKILEIMRRRREAQRGV